MIEIIGGPDRDRTDDLFHAMEARSQLRHRPTMTNLPILVESARFVKLWRVIDALLPQPDRDSAWPTILLLTSG
jgi:hypothetical protein